MNRKCLTCGKPIDGRADKKFCNRNCRNEYHNKNLPEAENAITEVNSILRKNRAILKALSPYGRTLVEKEFIDLQGFNFRFCTHIFKGRNNEVYFFCYEFGYRELDSEKIMIFKWQDYMKNNTISQ